MSGGYTKGADSREHIINAARELFNDHGIGITLAKLASTMNITLGRLTYHFPTKDSLFLAIAMEYEQKRALQRVRDNTVPFSLDAFYNIIGKAMDLQYEYRCAMRYITSSSNNQSELSTHTADRFRLNRDLIRQGVTFLVTNNELQNTILEEENFKVFLFTFTSLLTTWTINLEIYDHEKVYEEMKPIYLKGIFSTFLPYCTELGKEALRKVGFS